MTVISDVSFTSFLRLPGTRRICLSALFIMETQPEASTSYIPPRKHILSTAHLSAFRRSSAYTDIVGFVDKLNDSVVGEKLTEAGGGSDVGLVVVGVLTV
jgi:hypothetical protein